MLVLLRGNILKNLISGRDFGPGTVKTAKNAKKYDFVQIKSPEATGRRSDFWPAQCTVSSREYGAPETIEENHRAQLTMVIIFTVRGRAPATVSDDLGGRFEAKFSPEAGTLFRTKSSYYHKGIF